jgi:tetratricopeptide (TPR) repeat protein
MNRLDPFRWLPAFVALAAFQTPAVLAQLPASAPAGAQTQSETIAPQLLSPEELGDTLMAHQRYQAAIDAYKRAPTDSPIVWNKLGIAYQMMFEFDEADRCYRTSLKLNPRSAIVLNNLGSIYSSLQRYSAAERMFRKALKIDPHSAMILKNLGTDQLAQHKYKQGARSYQAALALDPHILEPSSGPRTQSPATIQDRGAMNYYMALGCVRVGLNQEAIEYLRMAFNEGFINPRKVAADSQFASLRGIPAFDRLVATQANP